jgi:hypothetical protein
VIDDQRTWSRGFWRLLLDGAALGLSLVLLSGLALRIADEVRDPVLLGMRYATPWPVLGALAFTIAALWWKGRRRCALVALSGAMAATALWWSRSHRSHPPQHAPAEVRIAYWNAARPPARAPRAAEFAASLQADLLALGETGAGAGYVPKDWRDRFADRTVVPMRGGMMLITRGRATLLEHGLLGGSGNYGIVAVELDGFAWTVIVVDLFAIPWHPRQPAFDHLARLIAEHGGPRLIVLGDFNTPGDAPATAVLRRTMHDAFESAGHGWAETWPVPFPVLSLDHIWLSRDVRALRCEHGWGWLSDHRPVIATVAP